MNGAGRKWCGAIVAWLLCLPGSAVGQATDTGKQKTLVVNGHVAAGAVVQINGHSYIDLEALAQVTNASLKIQPDRIILTLPGANAGARPPEEEKGISKDFARAAIPLLEGMREWKGAIKGVIMRGTFAGTWLAPFLADYHSRAEASLQAAAVAATTASDQQALQLLRNEFANLHDWDTQSQAAIRNMDSKQTVDPNALENDPLLTKISDCDRFLSVMIVGNEFADNPSCH